ncbi:MAG TPA: IS3 family transposase [Kofleriaceae bacterium]|nr:IS3 family transposase [Kofleriaceae bacterium]
MKFHCIDVEKANFPVAFMCRCLRVSRSGYYAWREREPSERSKRDAELVPLIRTEFGHYKRGCGSRTILGALVRANQRVSRKRVIRLMVQENLRPRLKRAFRHTTQSKHTKPIAPNVLDRAFDAGQPHRAWAGDITAIYTKKGWAYVAVLIDIGIRRVVGWSVGTSISAELAMRALTMALHDREPPPGVIHHSDRGVQYTSNEYQATLAERGFICSMSRKGNCWDNAVVESFFSAMKREMPNDELYFDAAELEFDLFRYIAAHYNTRRRHSALGYLTPTEFEMRSAA